MITLVLYMLSLVVLIGIVHVAALAVLTWLPPFQGKPMRVWIASISLSLLLSLIAAIRLGPVGWLSLGLVIAAIPLSFMTWSVLHWGATVTMWRVIRNTNTPLDLGEWQACVTKGNFKGNLVENRLILLKRTRLVRISRNVPGWERTTLGNSLVCLSRAFSDRYPKAD